MLARHRFQSAIAVKRVNSVCCVRDRVQRDVLIGCVC